MACRILLAGTTGLIKLYLHNHQILKIDLSISIEVCGAGRRRAGFIELGFHDDQVSEVNFPTIVNVCIALTGISAAITIDVTLDLIAGFSRGTITARIASGTHAYHYTTHRLHTGAEQWTVGCGRAVVVAVKHTVSI
jgi:hypothetical protein